MWWFDLCQDINIINMFKDIPRKNVCSHFMFIRFFLKTHYIIIWLFPCLSLTWQSYYFPSLLVCLLECTKASVLLEKKSLHYVYFSFYTTHIFLSSCSSSPSLFLHFFVPLNEKVLPFSVVPSFFLSHPFYIKTIECCFAQNTHTYTPTQN